MRRIYCDYSKAVHEYLRILGQDVSRIDDMVASGYRPTFIGSHCHDSKRGWVPRLGAIAHECDGGYLDNGFRKMMPNGFYERFGGYRHGKRPSKIVQILNFLFRGELGKYEVFK